MLATANVMDLFANELTGLRRRPFSFASISASRFEGSSSRAWAPPYRSVAVAIVVPPSPFTVIRRPSSSQHFHSGSAGAHSWGFVLQCAADGGCHARACDSRTLSRCTDILESRRPFEHVPLRCIPDSGTSGDQVEDDERRSVDP